MQSCIPGPVTASAKEPPVTILRVSRGNGSCWFAKAAAPSGDVFEVDVGTGRRVRFSPKDAAMIVTGLGGDALRRISDASRAASSSTNSSG